MTQPIRIQRKRTKGYNLQTDSLARNGLPCVYVGRPSDYGNPWTIKSYYDAGYSGDERVATAACVEMYRSWLTQTRCSWLDGGQVADTWHRPPDVEMLRGKNLACWCSESAEFCHADTLLELANK